MRRIGLVGRDFGGAGDALQLELLQRALQPAQVFASKAGKVSGTRVRDISRIERLQDELDLLVVVGSVLDASFLSRLGLDRLRIPYGFLSAGVPHPERLDGAQEILRNARFVTVRDYVALAAVRELDAGIDAWWLPDAGFLLAVPEHAAAYGLPREPRRDEPPRVLLVPRAVPELSLGPDDPPDAGRALVRAFSNLPRDFGDRAAFTMAVFEKDERKLRAKGSLPVRVLGARDAVLAIADADALVTARLQAAVVAACVGTPFALVDYELKMSGFSDLFSLRRNALVPLAHPWFHKWLEATFAAPGPSVDPGVAQAYGKLVHRMCAFLREGP